MYHLNESVLCLCWRAPQCESLSIDRSKIQVLVTVFYSVLNIGWQITLVLNVTVWWEQ